MICCEVKGGCGDVSVRDWMEIGKEGTEWRGEYGGVEV